MAVRSLWRWALVGLLVLSLTWSGWSWWRLASSPAGAWLVERAEDQLDAVYTRALVRSATPDTLATAITRHLAAEPRNWVALDALAELADAQNVTLPPDVQTALSTARAADHSFAAGSVNCAACAYDLRACGLGPELVCGVGVNLTVAGDVLSLARESTAYVRGLPVDQVDVVLSFVGIGATALVVGTGGTSYTLKAGAGFLKVAHRTGRLAPDVTRVFTRAFSEGVEWARLARGGKVADAARMDALRPALALADDLGAMQVRLGTGAALHVLRQADTASDVRAMTRATRALGPRSVAALEVLGKSRILRLGLRWADEVWQMLAGLGAALSALGGLLGARALRALRRAALRV
jgi:hypothetical protein